MRLTHLLLVVGIGLVAIDASAQTETPADSALVKTKISRWYVRAGGGYGFTFAGQTDLSGLDMPISGSYKNVTVKIKRASYGEGIMVAMAGGYMFTPNIGVEFGLSTLVAPTRFHSYMGDIMAERYLDSHVQNLSYAIPSLIFRTNACRKVSVYGLLGAVIPLRDELKISEWGINDLGPAYTTEYTLKNYFTIGVKASAGVNYNVCKRLSLWVEGCLVARNTYAKELKTTAYTINNEDKINTLTTSERITEYKFDYSTSTYNANEPTSASTCSIPFSSIGLSAGVILSL